MGNIERLNRWLHRGGGDDTTKSGKNLIPDTLKLMFPPPTSPFVHLSPMRSRVPQTSSSSGSVGSKASASLWDRRGDMLIVSMQQGHLSSSCIFSIFFLLLNPSPHWRRVLHRDDLQGVATVQCPATPKHPFL